MKIEMKGQKTGGRKQGSPNRITKELRLILKELVFAELEKMPEIVAKLEDKDRLELLIKLLPYVLPKVNPVGATDGEPLCLNW